MILPDGKKLAATNIITRNGPDAITWQSKDRTLDGKALPDVQEIKMRRVPLAKPNSETNQKTMLCKILAFSFAVSAAAHHVHQCVSLGRR